MKCTQCGYVIQNSDAKYCDNCGAKLAEGVENEVFSQPNKNTVFKPDIKNNKAKSGNKKAKKGIIIASAVSVLIIALCTTIAIMFFTGSAYEVYEAVEEQKYENASKKYDKEVKDSFIQKVFLKILLGNEVDNIAEDYNNKNIDFATTYEALNALETMDFNGANKKLEEIMVSYSDQTVNKYNNGEIDYNTAKDVFVLLHQCGYDGATQRLIDIMKSHADYIMSEYNNGNITYDTAISIFEQLKNNGYAQASSFISNIQINQNAVEAIQNGDRYLKEGNYEDAIAEYSKVDESNSNYEEAQKKLDELYIQYIVNVAKDINEFNANKKYKEALLYAETAYDIIPDDIDVKSIDTASAESMSGYKAEITNSVTALLTKGEFVKAIEAINEAISIDNNQEFQALKTTTERKYIESVKKAVETYITDHEYKKAVNAVEQALLVLENNADLSALKTQIEEATPTMLNEVVVIDSSHYNYYKDPVTDSFGNLYDGFYNFDGYLADGYAIYNLNNKFSVFNCSAIARQSTSSSARFSLYIYLDGELAYTLNNYSRTTGKIDISIDVTNVTKMHIKTTCTEDINSDIALVNAELS